MPKRDLQRSKSSVSKHSASASASAGGSAKKEKKDKKKKKSASKGGGVKKERTVYRPGLAVLDDITGVLGQAHERAMRMADSMKYPNGVRKVVARLLNSLHEYNVHKVTEVCEGLELPGADMGEEVIDLGDEDTDEGSDTELYSVDDGDDDHAMKLFEDEAPSDQEVTETARKGKAPEMREGPVFDGDDLGGISVDAIKDTKKTRRSAFSKATEVTDAIRQSGLAEEAEDNYKPDASGDEDFSEADSDSDSDSAPGDVEAETEPYLVILQAECQHEDTEKEACKEAHFQFKSQRHWENHADNYFDDIPELFNKWLQENGHAGWYVDDVIETVCKLKPSKAVNPVIVKM